MRPSLPCHVALGLAALAPAAPAQTLGPDFASDYTVTVLPVVPPNGGVSALTFKNGDPSKIVFGRGGTIFEQTITRGADGNVNGYAGAPVIVSSAPNIDGGLRYAPNGVLLFTTWPSNMLGQIRPGSVAPDRMVDLTAVGLSASTGGLALTPAGFPGAGKLRLTNYNLDQWSSADLVPDAMGTYDVVNASVVANFTGISGPESIVYVDSTYPAFSTRSVLVDGWASQDVVAYAIDAQGDVDPSTPRTFLDGFLCSGSAVDPMTGAFIFPGYTNGELVVVKPNVQSIGTAYCQTVPNSTGASSALEATGSALVAANDVTLRASSLPAGATIYFLTSQTQGFTQNPGGSAGNLCLAGSIGRFVAPGQIGNTGAAGAFALALDLAVHPTPGGPVSVAAGETWRFQAWHRDVTGVGTPTSNLTNGLAIQFQ